MDPIIAIVARELSLPVDSVNSTAELLNAGNTIPFIARYRKEATGGLDEVQLRQVQTRLEYLRKLIERRAAIRDEVASQGKLSAELSAQLDATSTLQGLEDLYRPYRPKRQTRAAIARERGLEPLARLLLDQKPDVAPAVAALAFLNDSVVDVAAALAGARDIVAENVSDDPNTRLLARQRFAADGFVTSVRASEAADESGRYRVYHDFRCALRQVQPHQWLALTRGAADGILKVELETPDADISAQIVRSWTRSLPPGSAEQVRLAIEDGYSRLLRPSIEREISGQLGEYAGDHAIQVFAANLRKLLLQRPVRERSVMGIDPGFRTGCKVATVDPTGRLLHIATIYPHPPQRDIAKAMEVLRPLVEDDSVSVIAIGNGTASRETEEFVTAFVKSMESSEREDRRGRSNLAYVIVSEAGASVYSASDLARSEFPDLDVSLRGAISIARRLQDPLAELVKIDPKSIGVGLYQHDVDQAKLGATLDAVVESVVDFVGVDVNTASAQLLCYVSGINKKVAGAIVAHRDENGPFNSRDDLKKVKGLGPKAYEQSAGFLRVPSSANQLDNTAIHPESYGPTKALLERAGLGLRVSDLTGSLRTWLLAEGLSLEEEGGRWTRLAAALSVGEPTLRDIVDALLRPGRDPRDDLPPVALRRDVLGFDDLREGMVLKGTVRNVVDFGAFIDIGVKHDGLVHVSRMGRKYVRNPQDVLGVGDVVDVTVISLDRERQRIGLELVRS